MKKHHIASVFAKLPSVCCFQLFFYINCHSFHLSCSQYVSFKTRPILQDIKVLKYFPNPKEFWTEFITPSKPVLFRHLLRFFPAFYLWSDDYLSLNYGHTEVVVETQREENRTAKPISMLFSEFLRQYQTKDIYMITVADFEWLSDISMPKLLQCGNLQKSFTHINIWMSNGGTKSVLHRDANDNIHCVVDGSKEIVLINKTMEEKIHVNQEGYSDMDLEKDDISYMLLEVPWYKATVNAGDCIFIPYMWFHQVKSSNVRNLSLNWWLNHLLWFNASDCENQQLEDWTPSNSFQFPTKAQKEHFQLLQSISGKHNFTKEQFLDSFQEIACKNVEVKQLFRFLDQNKNGIVTLEEMYGADSVTFASYFVNCSFNHDEL